MSRCCVCPRRSHQSRGGQPRRSLGLSRLKDTQSNSRTGFERRPQLVAVCLCPRGVIGDQLSLHRWMRTFTKTYTIVIIYCYCGTLLGQIKYLIVGDLPNSCICIEGNIYPVCVIVMAFVGIYVAYRCAVLQVGLKTTLMQSGSRLGLDTLVSVLS